MWFPNPNQIKTVCLRAIRCLLLAGAQALIKGRDGSNAPLLNRIVRDELRPVFSIGLPAGMARFRFTGRPRLPWTRAPV